MDRVVLANQVAIMRALLGLGAINREELERCVAASKTALRELERPIEAARFYDADGNEVTSLRSGGVTFGSGA